jgi:hypothetical protein
MESVYHIVTVHVNETSWAQVWRLRSSYLGMGYDIERTRRFGLKMNPKKCAFGVSAGQFLGFLVHERGIEIGPKSQEAIRTMVQPTMKRELQ